MAAVECITQEQAQSCLEDLRIGLLTLHHYLPTGNQYYNSDTYKPKPEAILVQVHFTLKHWSISGKNKTPCDTYAADIFSMHVLIPPATSGPITPKKRKFLQTDPLTPDIDPKKIKAFASSA